MSKTNPLGDPRLRRNVYRVGTSLGWGWSWGWSLKQGSAGGRVSHLGGGGGPSNLFAPCLSCWPHHHPHQMGIWWMTFCWKAIVITIVIIICHPTLVYWWIHKKCQNLLPCCWRDPMSQQLNTENKFNQMHIDITATSADTGSSDLPV